MTDRYFWLPNVKVDNNIFTVELDREMDYSDTTKAMRYLLAEAGSLTYAEAMQYTWHSMKATMINAALHRAENPMVVGLQGHWKNPMGPMPVKYMRSKLEAPIAMVERVCRASQWYPAGTRFGVSARQGLRGVAAVHVVQNSRALCGRFHTEALAEVQPVSMADTCRECRRAIA